MTQTESLISKFIEVNILRSGSAAAISVDTPLLADGLLDSLNLQEIVAFLERHFGISVSERFFVPEYFESIRAMAQLVRLLQS